MNRIVSGIQPSGKLHIGNYLGMLKQSIALQEQYDCFYFIADLHSLTQTFDSEKKRSEIFELMADMLALGFDPKKSTLYIQSHIPQHTELAWVFNCLTPFTELKRMTQFKDKSAKEANNVNVGLFDYPVLQAADIHMYKPHAVPVGKDQEQHLELSRQLARTFNRRFGKTFMEVKPIFTTTPIIKSLSDPTRKMSKSHGIDKVIALDDEPDVIAKKVRKAVTTPQGVKNLQTLIKSFGGPETYDKNNNLEMKNLLTDILVDYFADYRKKKKQLMKDKAAVVSAFGEGAKKAKKIADATMKEVREKIGLV